MRKFLVMCRTGDNSLHKNWINNPSRDFDLFISYYGDNQNIYQNDAEYYVEQKGPKWPVLFEHIRDNLDTIKKYDAIWLPDDDLMADSKTIDRLFHAFSLFDISLGQPALEHGSYSSYDGLMRQPETYIRYVNFVEVMAPIFKTDTLMELYQTFSLSKSGWGLDNLWPHIIKNACKTKIAIIDAAAVTHTRPLGGELYKNNPSLSPFGDVETIQALYPQFDINIKAFQNKFRVFGAVKTIKRRPSLLAYLVGKRHRKYGGSKRRPNDS